MVLSDTDAIVAPSKAQKRGRFGISDERRVDFIASEIWLPQVSAKGDKMERARVKETNETWRQASEILLHAETCSHGPAGRPVMTGILALLTGHRPVATPFVKSRTNQRLEVTVQESVPPKDPDRDDSKPASRD
jgi:hypothetical protein